MPLHAWENWNELPGNSIAMDQGNKTPFRTSFRTTSNEQIEKGGREIPTT